MRTVLGIDQGGSKTHAVIVNEQGELLGLGCGAGACHSTHGMEYAMQAIADAIHQAEAMAQMDVRDVSYVSAGLTGIDWPHEASMLRGELSGRFSIAQEHISVVNDCVIALRAGSSSQKSCILCAGSGLNCAVQRDAEHRWEFGFYIADSCQGGNALAERTVQAVLDAEIGLEPATCLTAMTLEHFGVPSVDALLERKVTTGLDRAKMLELPKLLEKAAEFNDGLALELLARFGHDVARYVVAGLRRMDMLHEKVEVVLSGSVFKCRQPILEESIAAEIHRYAGGAYLVDGLYEPIIGAALLALDHLADCDPTVVNEHIKRDAMRFHMIRKNQKREEQTT